MQTKKEIPTSATLKAGDKGEVVQRVQDYLKQFGYFDSPVLDMFAARESATVEPPPTPGVYDEHTQRAVEQFQAFAGIPVTGELDNATINMMGRPRCGFPDTANFVIDGRKWDHTNITFSFRELSPDLPANQLRQAIRDAFELWDDASSLTFQEVDGQADIVISFVAANHGDGDGFDGPGQVLAHAFFPPPNSGELAGDAHFDEDERWSIDIPASGTDLITVAAHEFGHSLGLAHSQVQNALMFPFFSGPNRRLHDDDIAGIQSLYGA